MNQGGETTKLPLIRFLGNRINFIESTSLALPAMGSCLAFCKFRSLRATGTAHKDNCVTLRI